MSALLVCAAAATPALALAPLDHAAVLAAVPGVVAGGAPSVVAYGNDESGEWSTAAGVASLKSGAPASPDAAFRIGSISKTFVAVAVLKLVAAGLIDLDAPVGTYLPGLLARGDVITIRELLQHRSGLGPTSLGSHGNNWFPAVNRSCSPGGEDPVAVIKAADVQLFEPGTSFNYANAGYTTLGLVIAKVTGTPYEQVIHDRIVVPLGLAHTSFQEGPPVWPGAYLRGYGDFLPGAVWHKNYTDETDCSMALFGAAGSGISTARDLAVFMRALVGGQLLPDDLYQQMIDGLPTDFGPGVTYGLGIVREERCGTVLLGHGGSVWGYQSSAYATIDGTRTLAMGFPLYPGTDAMWNGVSVVAHAEFCGGA